MKHNEIVLTGSELAAVLNITDRRVRQLASEGLVEAGPERGEYMLHPSVSRYIAALESRRDPALEELNKTRAKMARIDLGKREGTLISLDEALGSIDEVTGTFVSALGRLPAMIAKKRDQTSAEYQTESRRIEDIIDQFRLQLVADIEKLDLPGQPGKPDDDE